MASEITFALHIPTGKIIHIDKAANGDACNCICDKCNGLLSAVQGNIKEHYFRHQTNGNCNANFETALHLAAKRIIIEGQEISLPIKGNHPYKYAQDEFKISKDFRPDIEITDLHDKKIYIEITVTCGISEAKQLYFKKQNKSLIDIDLSNVDRNIDYEQLKRLILYKSDFKSVINWEGNEVSNKFTFREKLLLVLIMFGAYRFVRWPFNR